VAKFEHLVLDGGHKVKIPQSLNFGFEVRILSSCYEPSPVYTWILTTTPRDESNLRLCRLPESPLRRRHRSSQIARRTCPSTRSSSTPRNPPRTWWPWTTRKTGRTTTSSIKFALTSSGGKQISQIRIRETNTLPISNIWSTRRRNN